MSDDQYSGREQSYYAEAPHLMAAMMIGATEADCLQKQASIELLETLIYATDPKTGKLDYDKPLANLDMKMAVDLPPIDGKPIGKVEASLSLPPVLLVPPTMLAASKVTVDGSMAVHSSVEDTKSLAAKEGLSGEGKAGWGPFSISVKVTGEASQSEASKRASDYRARMNWSVEMSQQPMSEAFQRTIDGVTREVVDTGISIFGQIVREQVEAAAKKAGINPPPSPVEAASGGSTPPTGGGDTSGGSAGQRGGDQS